MKPYYQRGDVTLYNADCLDILPTLESGSVDAVVTDPPYGVDKAEWDNEFPTEWYSLIRDKCQTSFVMSGNTMLPKCLQMVGDDYKDIFVIWLSNGMTLGPISFGNWIPVVVSQITRKHLGNQNLLRVVVKTDESISHPCPKPIEAMKKLIGTHTKPESSILDPFTGSGTTGVACVQLGRKFIGIEIEERYIRIAAERIDKAIDEVELEARFFGSSVPNKDVKQRDCFT